MPLDALSAADGTRTAWPAMIWTDGIEGVDHEPATSATVTTSAGE
ncbi:hypothetical protein O7632_28635 [Solwaraspora sp. WMMD406]|nr:hypothetical protein [Solwaraspora sp. WMMD406]MDG4768028.1 hypothetical protein [Solwaraspora sp. WMMD406]